MCKRRQNTAPRRHLTLGQRSGGLTSPAGDDEVAGDGGLAVIQLTDDPNAGDSAPGDGLRPAGPKPLGAINSKQTAVLTRPLESGDRWAGGRKLMRSCQAVCVTEGFVLGTCGKPN